MLTAGKRREKGEEYMSRAKHCRNPGIGNAGTRTLKCSYL